MLVVFVESAAVNFFFNGAATTELYTLSLHDALPIFARRSAARASFGCSADCRWGSSARRRGWAARCCRRRSEEHTSELQSQSNLVCRLLLEKKNKLRHLLQ